jgi:hypothetical protein
MFAHEAASSSLSAPRSGRCPDTRVEAGGKASAIGCSLALLLAILGTVSCTAVAQPQSGLPQQVPAVVTESYEGMLSDARCGARHSAAIDEAATNCTITCLRAGEQFVLIDGDKVYLLDGDLMALKQVAGQRVRIVGTLDGTKIAVRSVAAA